MRVLVCGSRQWHDRSRIRSLLSTSQREAVEAGEEFVLIHGACPDGADRIADEIATSEMGMQSGVDLHRVPADWSRHGKAGGPIRNQRMLDQHHPTVVYAFRAEGKSSGTDDMVRRSKRLLGDQLVHVLTPEDADAS